MNPSGLAVRPGAPDDEDSVVAANLAMALETEDLVLNAEVLRRGVRPPLTAPPDCRYIIAQSTEGG